MPEVDRRDVRSCRSIPSNDFEIGLFVGTYATENFGSSLVGRRASSATTSPKTSSSRPPTRQTKVSDEAFRQILPGGMFADETEKLSYYNLSAGYNVLPGEVFIGSNRAMASQLYLIAGVGSTKLRRPEPADLQRRLRLRVFLTDRSRCSVDMRDHIFSLDILGKRQSTQNLELTRRA